MGAVVHGFVGSGTDGGHGNPTDDPGNTCDQAVPSINHLNGQYIQDWIYTGPQQEILQSKAVAKVYYGRSPSFNYWNGCSTGGHQGYALAQSLPGELQGVLASAPAMYWTRFQTAQMWGQIAMLDIADEVISGSKLAAVQLAATAACDDNDGVADGIIDDPRTCTFNAQSNVCGVPGAPAAPNCLTATEADAVNTMWDGPRNKNGVRIWFPIDRGSDFSIWDGNVPFGLAPVQLGWDLQNPAYFNAGSFPGSYPGFWGNVALSLTVQAGSPQPGDPAYVTNYPAVAEVASKAIADLTDTFGNLDAFRAAGAKMVTFVGANDQFIMPRGVINYYRTMAQRYQMRNDRTGFEGVRQFYRLFHVPGVGHCGLPIFANGSVGPWPQNGADFDAVINWVENGIAPSEVMGAGNQAGEAPVPSLARIVRIRKPRSMSAATSWKRQTGHAVATWKGTFRSARRCPGLQACRCRVAMLWRSTSTKPRLHRRTMGTAASTRPSVTNLTSGDGGRTVAASQIKQWQSACAARRTLRLRKLHQDRFATVSLRVRDLMTFGTALRAARIIALGVAAMAALGLMVGLHALAQESSTKPSSRRRAMGQRTVRKRCS